MKPFSSFIVTLLLTGGTQAHANLVANPGFETFTGVFGSDGGSALNSLSTTLTDWTVTTGEIAVLTVPNIYHLTPAEGNNFLDLTGYSNSGFPKGVTQTLTGLSVGQSYRLSLDIGILNGACIGSSNDCHGPVQVNAAIGGTSQTFTHDSADPGNVWGTYGFDFTATAADMALTVTGVSIPVGNAYIGLDNLDVEETSAVPLPAALWMFGAGLGGAVAVGRRRA